MTVLTHPPTTETAFLRRIIRRADSIEPEQVKQAAWRCVQQTYGDWDDRASYEMPMVVWLMEFADARTPAQLTRAIESYLPDDTITPPPWQMAEPIAPMRRPKAPVTSGWFARLIAITLLSIAIFALANAYVRRVYTRDLINEVRILYASTQGQRLNTSGEWIAWHDGEVSFLSHDYTCAPTFHAVSAAGHLLPPPSEWPAQDAYRLLVSERFGCYDRFNRSTIWDGYWGSSSWGLLVHPRADTPAGAMLTDANSVKVWVSFASLSIAPGDVMRIARDLSAQQSAGETDLIVLTPTPLPPVAPTQIPQEGASAISPAWPTSMPAPPSRVPEQGAGAVTAATETPVVPSTTPVFMTQTPEPTPVPTATSTPTAGPFGQRPVYTANDGTVYSADCSALHNKYKNKTDDTVIPTADFVALVNCKLTGKTTR